MKTNRTLRWSTMVAVAALLIMASPSAEAADAPYFQGKTGGRNKLEVIKLRALAIFSI